MQPTARWVESAYDRIATSYDERWSVHIREPAQRLTETLRLAPGMRCADLGCGTGLDTLDMARITAPEPVVAVDCSEKMLDELRAKARERGYPLRTACTDAETFIAQAESESFDVFSLRFCLAYVDWRAMIPKLRRALRPRGRLAILTNLGTSAPQAYATYRSMVEKLGVPEHRLPVPSSREELVRALLPHGFVLEQAWSHNFTLWFDTGTALATWLADSGFVTHPALATAPSAVRRALWDAFASRIERFREPKGIPLDFELAGVTANRP